jgi:hypothetical protein
MNTRVIEISIHPFGYDEDGDWVNAGDGDDIEIAGWNVHSFTRDDIADDEDFDDFGSATA